MTSLPVVDRSPLADAVQTRLETQLPGVAGYVGEPSNVPLKPNSDGRVAKYWVLHTSIGTPTSEVDLGDTVIDLNAWFQINCAGDSDYDVRNLATAVDAALFRWTPVIETGPELQVVRYGRMKPPPGYDPGPIRPDTSEKPHRFWVPLQYVTTGTVT